MKKRIATFLGDYYHDGELSRGAIDEALKPLVEAGLAEVEHRGVEDWQEVLASKPDMVILFLEDRVNPAEENMRRWMTEEAAAAIVGYVEAGGAWLAWHSGLASYDESEHASEYVRMLRGAFISHPRDHQNVIYSPVQDSVIGKGAEAYEVIDEQYFVRCDEANTEVFLRSHSETDGDSAAGWTHEFGQGKVSCFTPAHRREGLFHPATSAYLRNIAAWSVQLNG